jgi:hypothetical protein
VRNQLFGQAPRAMAALLIAALALRGDSKKQIEEQRLELLRGLGSEYATARTYMPRSKTPLGFEAATGYWNESGWQQLGAQTGPAARKGDLVQITKVTIQGETIVLELNNGFNSQKGRWYSNGGPITDTATPAPGGTTISVHYDGGLSGVTSEKVKKDLAPILAFDQRSATETYTETLPPEIRGAIENKKVTVGMTREQVLLAVGQPVRKSRENVNGVDLEDWIYGNPPGKVTFVTLKGQKVIKVFEDYAVPGGSVAESPHTP